MLNTPDHKTDLEGLDLLDREDLIAMVKRMVNGGVSLGFHGKRTAVEIARKTVDAYNEAGGEGSN